jgi:hypothetical protein
MLQITHNGGFFSCCTIRLEKIIEYFNANKCCPLIVDSSQQFALYKPYNSTNDITEQFFTEDKSINIIYNDMISTTSTKDEQQFSNYKLLNFKQVKPFVDKYFKLSDSINKNIKHIEDKYKLNYDKICVVFYRGLDKQIETIPPSYNDMISKANEFYLNNKDYTFLLQSDETEFIQEFLKHFSNVIIFKDEIYHFSKNVNGCIQHHLHPSLRLEQSKNFLSIVKIMSKAKHIITTSGSISYWMCLFRENSNNVEQYLSRKPYIYGVKNLSYDPNNTLFWL